MRPYIITEHVRGVSPDHTEARYVLEYRNGVQAAVKGLDSHFHEFWNFSDQCHC